MLIFINRVIFNTLFESNKKVAYNYIYEKVVEVIEDELTAEDLSLVVEGIFEIIKRNEAVIEEYGLEKWQNEDYPASKYVSGYWYKTWKIIVVPFDWDINGEEDDNYTFTLARIL